MCAKRNEYLFWMVLEKLEPHILGMNRLVGTYQRD